MIIELEEEVEGLELTEESIVIIETYDFDLPTGITNDSFTAKGTILVGLGAGVFAELPPGEEGQYLTPDENEVLGLKWEVPSISISDTTNILINGGYDIAQRQDPATFTTIAIEKFGADRHRITRENADLQYQREDATGETGLTSKYFGKYKKITNAGKFMEMQIIEGVNSVPLRSKTVIFQKKMKASSSKTIRMAILELQNAGAMDTIPGTFVTAWGADTVDPTLGANLAIIKVESKSVTTAWQNFSVSADIPSNSKNVIVAIWSDSDFAVNDELHVAEEGLFLGSTIVPWNPRAIEQEIALCQRYYLRLKLSINGRFCMGRVSTTTRAYGIVSFPVEMRIAPTSLEQSGTAADYAVAYAATAASCSSVPTRDSSTNFLMLLSFHTAGVLTVGHGVEFFEATGNGYLGFPAEL